jgi:hypothetical protein
MRHKLLAGLVIALSLPAMAHAQIYSNTSASSNSGGNVVGPGGSIRTGDSSASVSASNSSASGTSSSSIRIRTTVNGEAHEESFTSGSGDVSVSVRSTPKETVIETREGTAPAVKKVIPAQPKPQSAKADAKADTQASAKTEAQATAQADAAVAAAPAASAAAASEEAEPGLGAWIIRSVQSFFAGLFSWFA